MLIFWSDSFQEIVEPLVRGSVNVFELPGYLFGHAFSCNQFPEQYDSGAR